MQKRKCFCCSILKSIEINMDNSRCLLQKKRYKRRQKNNVNDIYNFLLIVQSD